jgi:hypothetical protein
MRTETGRFTGFSGRGFLNGVQNGLIFALVSRLLERYRLIIRDA